MPSPNPIYTVGQINTQIKLLLERSYPAVLVQGELKEAKVAGRGGHLYGKLTDGENNLAIVIWNYNLQRLGIRPEQYIGQEVLVHGKISSFPGRGDNQIIVDGISPKGVGTQLLALEALKNKLAAEGLFAPERKRPLPAFPHNIAVITSETGAAIHDIAITLQRRFPLVKVYLFPAQVQGAFAAGSILKALKMVRSEVNNLQLDLLILGRGGGGSEDLAVFNDEAVVRAAAVMPIPVISAVGHQINQTLLDLAADVTVATPTAAATRAVPDMAELTATLQRQSKVLGNSLKWLLAEGKQELLANSGRLDEAMRQVIGEAGQRLDELDERLAIHSPERLLWAKKSLFSEYSQVIERDLAQIIIDKRQKLQELRGRFELGMTQLMAERHELVEKQAQRLKDLSPERVLDRGYAILLDGNKQPVLVNSATAGDNITAVLKGGTLLATVKEVKSCTDLGSGGVDNGN